MFRCLDLLQTCLRSLRLCVPSKVSEEERKASKLSAKIDRDIFDQAKLEMETVKILILGTAESGKSTLMKQMKIIHSHGFTKQELLRFKPAVLDNLLTSMKCVLHGMGALRINLSSHKNKAHACSILSCESCVGEDQELFPFVAHALCSLWGDHGVRVAASRGHEFQLNDSALYFFRNMRRIIAPNFVPTETDVLRVRLRTCGITETQFRVNKQLYRLFHVGGQHTARRMWLSYFDDVHAVVFMVALSGYDLMQTDNPSMNRLQESLELFASICNHTYFRRAVVVLFMSKMDLFREKIMHSGRHLRLYLPDYKGAVNDVNAAAHYITSLFLERNTVPNKQMYHHFTNATDTCNVQDAFQVVMNRIVQENLEAVPML